MKLNVFGSVAAAYAFGLRHFPAFYLLAMLASVPEYLYSFLPCPESQARLAADCTETLISCLVVAVMSVTLKRDRRAEAWTVLPSLRDTFERPKTVLGVSFVSTTIVVALSLLGGVLMTVHPLASIVATFIHLILVAFFCLAIPCAATGEGGIAECFRRSTADTAGSRLRIVAAYLLVMLPGMVVWGGLTVFADDLQVEGLWEMWSFIGLPALTVFILALPAVIHARLASPGDDVLFGRSLAVFD